MGFPEQLRKARIQAGLTQIQIAEALGIKDSTYSGYETGKRHPDVEKIKQLLKILNTSGDFLLETGLDETPTQDEKYLIELYNKTDDFGRETIRIIAERECKRADSVIDLKR